MTSSETLPASLEAERFVLGSVMLDAQCFDALEAALKGDDFSLEKHRRIYTAMRSLKAAGDPVDRVTVTHELMRLGMLDSVGGIGYVNSLDDGLPQILNIDAYVRIVQEKATLRKAIDAASHLINRCMTAAEGSQEILSDAEAVIGRLGQERQPHGQWLTPYEIFAQEPNRFLNPPQGGGGIATPWPNLTEKLCGLHKGDLFIVAGRPSMGKSLAAIQMCHHAAVDSECGAAIFSLEMSKESIVQRMISASARVDSHRIRSGYIDANERERVRRAVESFSQMPLWIDETRARTIPAVTAALRKLTAKQRVDIVVIDHLQLMHSIRRGDSRNNELGDICHSLKHLAGDFGVVMILLSQLNRQCEIENRRPQLSDLRETGDLEQDADEILFVHRPERYAKNHGREDLRGYAEFILAKQRDGQTGLLQMVFLGPYQRFEVAAPGTLAGGFQGNDD